jgi:hypothetical protein
MSTAPCLTVATSFPRRFVAKSQSRVARPTRGGAQDRGVLEKYVEGLSNEPVGLATLGCGQACRSSGSAIAAELQALMIHEGSSRKRADATRDGHSEP